MASMLQFAQDLSNLPLPAAASAADRAQRSVFVGNIPYDATEEQLREVFIQAGPVVSFRLVYDRETGKPKGYGFCEYQDVETAQSAMRNLNNYDFNGRPLRVGVAAGEQSKDEGKALQQALGGQIVESPYGEPVEPEKAPEAISKAVASLPPEQMFELMKQMKLCIQNNPNEARNMLLQNPQLAYALLQAQIVMKIVDPQVAMSMLYRDETQPQVSVPNNAPKAMPGSQPVIGQPVVGQQVVGQQVMGQQVMGQQVMGQQVMGQQVMGQPRMQQGLPVPMGGVNPGFIGINPGAMNPQMRPDMMVRQNLPQEVGDARRFPQPNNMPGPGVRMQAPGMMPNQRPVMNQPNNPMPGAAGPSANGTANISTQDQEKAALIMQVLQLTDEQIALLPPEQRHSILILKEQIKSG